MKVIHEWKEDNDGIPYSCKAFSDGHVERNVKQGYENVITNTEERQLELSANVQYLADLAEINGGA